MLIWPTLTTTLDLLNILSSALLRLQTTTNWTLELIKEMLVRLVDVNKKVGYRRGTARRAMLVDLCYVHYV